MSAVPLQVDAEQFFEAQSELTLQVVPFGKPAAEEHVPATQRVE